MKKIILIISLCFAGLIFVALSLALSTYLQDHETAPLSKPPAHGLEFLVQADFSQNAGNTNSLASLKKALFGRFSGMGRRVFIESLPPSQLRVELPVTNNDEANSISNAIARRGYLELRMVHDDSDEIITNSEPIPPGYEVLQSLEVTPGRSTPERLVVKIQPEDSLAGNLVQSALVGQDTYGPQIEFTLNKDAAARFARVTTKYAPMMGTHHRLAIVLDGNLYSAPMINAPIVGGRCAITGNYTDEEAQRLVDLLNHPLPVPVKIVTMKSF